MPVPQTIVLSPRLSLEFLTLVDHESVYALFHHPNVVKQYAEQPIAKLEDTSTFIEKITAPPNLAFALKDTQRGLIGLCGLHHWHSELGEVEMGGTLHPDFWGKGIMHLALGSLLQALQQKESIRQVVMRTQPNNHAALRLAQKLGFEPIGIENEEAVLKRILRDRQ
jgi:[ribosomal protein S5]-alanine N-acetyltransferase